MEQMLQFQIRFTYGLIRLLYFRAAMVPMNYFHRFVKSFIISTFILEKLKVYLRTFNI